MFKMNSVFAFVSNWLRTSSRTGLKLKKLEPKRELKRAYFKNYSFWFLIANTIRSEVRSYPNALIYLSSAAI